MVRLCAFQKMYLKVPEVSTACATIQQSFPYLRNAMHLARMQFVIHVRATYAVGIC